jgi:CheY-like chemotaxis protein
MDFDTVFLRNGGGQPMRLTDDRPLVVVVENERRIADALSMLIEDWGFSCLAVPSISSAARALGPDVRKIKAVIADYHLDDEFTGDKAAAALATAIGFPVPTIMMTGHVAMADHQTKFPVLPKPFDPDILKSWLETNVGRPHP